MEEELKKLLESINKRIEFAKEQATKCDSVWFAYWTATSSELTRVKRGLEKVIK